MWRIMQGLLMALLLLAPATAATEYANCAMLSSQNDYSLEWNIRNGTFDFRISIGVATDAPALWVSLGVGTSLTRAMTSNGACLDALIVSAPTPGSGGVPCPAGSTCVDSDCTICSDDLWICDKPSASTTLLDESRDTASNDWTVTSVSHVSSLLVIEGHRPMAAGNASEDRDIRDGLQVLAWSFGKVDSTLGYLQHPNESYGALQLNLAMPSSSCTFSDVATVSQAKYPNRYFTPSGLISASWDFDEARTEMYVELVGVTDGWMSFGLNTQPSMIGLDVFVADMSSGALEYFDGVCTGHSRCTNDTEIGGTSNVRNVTATQTTAADGSTIFTVRFTRDVASTDEYDVAIPSSGLLYVAMALGDTVDGRQNRHSVYALEDMNVWTATLADRHVSPLRPTHGTLMLFAWGFFIPCGVLVAKFLKFLASWFWIHIALQVTGLVTSFAGLGVIFVALDSRLVVSAHAALGIAVLAGGLLQVIIAVAGMYVPEGARGAMDFMHRNFGRLVSLGAVVQLFLGVQLLQTSEVLYILLGAWCGVALVVIVIMLLRERRTMKPAGPSSAELLQMAVGDMLSDTQEKIDIEVIQEPPAEDHSDSVSVGVLFVWATISLGLTIAFAVLLFVVVASPSLSVASLDGRGTELAFSSYSSGTIDSDYICRLFMFPTDKQRDAVRFEPIVGDHVLEVTLFNVSVTDSQLLPSGYWDCTEMATVVYPIYTWSKKSESSSFSMPADVGMRFGESAAYMTVLQIRYDRSYPLIDSSGVLITWADSLRATEASLLRLGVPEASISIPANRTLTIGGACSAQATATLPEGWSFNVFGSIMYMRDRGTTARAELWRDGALLKPSFASVNDYKVGESDIQAVNDVVVQGGDSVRTFCTWDTFGATETTRGGYEAHQERCHHFVFIYPPIPGDLHICGS